MDNTSKNIITPFDLTLLIVGSMCGIRVLHASNQVAEIAKQDGWICIFFAGLYPILILLLTLYLSKKYPNDNILALSTKFLGNILGNVFNLGFLLWILFYICAGASSLSNVSRLYVSGYLIPLKIIFSELLVATYLSSRGLKPLTRVNNIIVLFMLFSSTILVPAFKEGTILNIMPIFGSSLKKLLLGSFAATTNYRGIELLLIYYPYISNKKQLKKSAFLGVLITIIFLTWTSFITFYFLGSTIIPKNLYPFLFVSDNITIPVITNLRYIFLFIWTLVGFNFVSNYLFASDEILVTFLSNKKRNWFLLILLPLISYASMKLGNEGSRRSITNALSPYLSLFILVYIILIITMIIIRKGKANEKA